MKRLHIECDAILCDIEGTTGSTAFVKEVLFPYADSHLDAYLLAHRGEPSLSAILADTRKLAGMTGTAQDEDDVAGVLHEWIAQDRKETPLKELQGLIWENGYKNGSLRGHVYSDAVDALHRWTELGKKLYVYSSGSITAQKLLFTYSVAGDLSVLFSGYFDTTSGPKNESVSYGTIAQCIGLRCEQMLFLSDSTAELDAAAQAGMQAVHVVRESDRTVGTDRYQSIASFDELALDA